MRRYVVSVLVCACANVALGQVPDVLGYQGRLLKVDGAPEAGVVGVTFRVYDAATAGAALWAETQQVALSDGFYVVHLGSVTAFPAGVWSGTDRWLELEAGGATLTPRQRIGSVAYALVAGDAQKLGGRPASDYALAGGEMLLALELDEPTGTVFSDSSGRGNDATSPGSGIAVGSTGHTGRAVSFSGGVLIVPVPNRIPDSPQVWVESWVNPALPLNVTRTIVSQPGAWELRQVNQDVEFSVTTAGRRATPCAAQSTGSLLSGGVWAHVAGWYDGQNVQVAVNGRVKATVSCPFGRIAAVAPAGVYVGGIASGGAVTSPYAGTIDEVRVRATAARRYDGPSPNLVNVTVHSGTTRRAMVSGASITMESFPVEKRSPTSNLLVEGTISGWGNASGSMQQGWRLGSGVEVLGQSVMYGQTAHSKIYGTRVLMTGHTTTGVQDLVFRYFTQNGSGVDSPFLVYNPNSTDDGRLGQTQSVYTVWEIEP